MTEKGRGYSYAERADDKYHGIYNMFFFFLTIYFCILELIHSFFLLFSGVVKFDPATGKQFKNIAKTQSYSACFVDALMAEAEADKNVVAIHAAVGGGTGLNVFESRFPTRCFDVGIAGQHAVTFAAGLACEGLKPFCVIYSSFMQRAYDQVKSHHFWLLTASAWFIVTWLLN